MKPEQLDANVGAVITFLVVAALCIGASVSACVFLGFYWDILGVLGGGRNSGYKPLRSLIIGGLIALSLYIAYRCARKVR
jgi:hypothetical protein